jgi:hypothetical protein
MRSVVLSLFALCCAGWSNVAFAQGAPAAPPSSTPPDTAAAPPAQPPPAQPPPAQPAPAQPPPGSAAQPPQQAAPPPPPPSYPNAPQPGQEPPPPPPYPPLGGQPEPEVEKGDWDPWDHPTADTHNHDGFYLRLAIGFGGSLISTHDHIADNVGSTDSSGWGFGTSIGIGGALTDNLILNADFFQATTFNPSVDVDGHHVGDASRVGNDLGIGEDIEVAGLGIGLTYYIMPANVYLAGSIGFGQAVFEANSGDRAGSDIGAAANLMVGKEWWVGRDWGIGLAGQMILLTAHDDIVGRVRAMALSLDFSATYN